MGTVENHTCMRKDFQIYEEMRKYMRRPLVIYDFATDPFWISWYMREKNFYQRTHNWVRHNCCVRKGCGTIRESTTGCAAQLGAAQLGAAQLRMAQPERSKTEGGSERPGPTSLLECTPYFCWIGRIWVRHCWCVLAKCLDKEVKMFFPCYGIISAIR
jgi:hypothetical protein